MKRFAGSVGTADIYYKNQLIASANTLTDSTITISTTQDEIRGGMYAPVQFTFTHDASIKVALTDIIWDRNYLMLQLGAEFGTDGDNNAYTSETDTVTSVGTLPLQHGPVAMDFGCGQKLCLVSYRLEGSSDAWTTATVAEGVQAAQIADIPAGTYCVRYAYNNVAALKASIYSHIVPAEVRLVIRAPLFAGDACSASNATAAGEVQYVLPRFRFDGNVTINGAMSSNSTMALNGTALASDSGCDMNGGKLMDVIEVTPGTSWTDGVVGIALGDDAKATTAPDVYFVYGSGSTRKLVKTDIGTTVNVTGNVITSAFVWATAVTTGTISLANITTVAPLSVTTIA